MCACLRCKIVSNHKFPLPETKAAVTQLKRDNLFTNTMSDTNCTHTNHLLKKKPECSFAPLTSLFVFMYFINKF